MFISVVYFLVIVVSAGCKFIHNANLSVVAKLAVYKGVLGYIDVWSWVFDLNEEAKLSAVK